MASVINGTASATRDFDGVVQSTQEGNRNCGAELKKEYNHEESSTQDMPATSLASMGITAS